MALKISAFLLLIYIIKAILFSNPEDFIICPPFFYTIKTKFDLRDLTTKHIKTAKSYL